MKRKQWTYSWTIWWEQNKQELLAENDQFLETSLFKISDTTEHATRIFLEI